MNTDLLNQKNIKKTLTTLNPDVSAEALAEAEPCPPQILNRA